MDPRDAALLRTTLDEALKSGTTPGLFRAFQERVRELATLYEAARILNDPDLTEPEALSKLASLLPQAFLRPKDTAARILHGGASFESPGFRDSALKLSAPFHLADGRSGAVDIVVRPDSQAPIDPEERRLLESLASMIAGSLDRRGAQGRLKMALSRSVRLWDWDIPADRITWPDIHVGDPPRPFSSNLQRVLDHLHPDDRAAIRRRVEEFFADPARREHFAIQCRVAYPTSEYRWRHVTARLQRDREGKPVRMLGLSLDITEQVALLDRVRQAEKMDALGRLAAGVAHDFNNILVAVLGFGSVAKARLEEGHPAWGPVNEIVRAGEAAKGLVQQIVSFSRRQDLKSARIDLPAALLEWKEMIRRLIGSKYELKMDLAPDTPAVMADRSQLLQIFLNLAINARDAMPEGGTLTLRTRRGEGAVIEVQDTGHGIPTDVLDHIFEPFYTTKASGKGTGMGLATVHGIVTQSGGTIEIESPPGRGTLFRIFLPAAN